VGTILLREMRKRPELTDVSSDQQNGGLQASIVYDRATRGAAGAHAADDRRHPLAPRPRQRQVSTCSRS